MVTLLASRGHDVAILPQNAILIPPLALSCVFPRTTSLTLVLRTGTDALPSSPSTSRPDHGPSMRTERLGRGPGAPRGLPVRRSGAAARAEVELRRGGGARARAEAGASG